MDATDRKILQLLQTDASQTVKQIAARDTPVGDPVLEAHPEAGGGGLHTRPGRAAGSGKVNADVTVFVAIKTDQHTREWIERFDQVVNDLPEVMEANRMSGRNRLPAACRDRQHRGL